MHYELATHYAGQSLLDGFSFFTGEDPSGGFVKYVRSQFTPIARLPLKSPRP